MNKQLFLDLFFPLLLLPLVSPMAMFFVLPLFLQHLLTAEVQQHSIFFYYYMGVAPFIFLAFVHTIEYLIKKLSRFTVAILIILAMLATGIQWLAHQPMIKQRFICFCNQPPTDVTIRAKWNLIKSIPRDAGVIASFAYLAPLSQTAELYPYFKMYSPLYNNSQHPRSLAASVQYALIDLDDPWLVCGTNMDISATFQQVKELLGKNWQLTAQAGSAVLFKKSY